MRYPTSGTERTWATLAYVLSLCLPVVAPLFIFLVKHRSRFVAFHALQALFIQAGLFLMVCLTPPTLGILSMLGPLAILTLPVMAVAWLLGAGAVICKILGAINASAGRWYRIPLVWSYAERFA